MITQENKTKLRIAYLKVYDPSQPHMERKRAYWHEFSKLNLPGCWPCQTSSTFNEFESLAEDMSADEIQTFLNSNQTQMPIKKKATTKPTAKANKAVTKAKKAAAVKIVNEEVLKIETQPQTIEAPKATASLPGSLKFLYIPKRK